MKFKRLIEEQNRLECLKTKEELTDYGLEMLTELNQALQLLQTDVSQQREMLIAFENWRRLQGFFANATATFRIVDAFLESN